jgi:hypothetical protein
MKTDNREFFEQLGNLFYSLGVDRSVEPIEVSELKMLISKDWMSQPQDSDLPIPEGVHCMFLEIDTLLAADAPSDEAYRDFAQYYTLHSEIFTTELVERIRETALAINAFFPQHNAYKKNHLADLIILLKPKRKQTSFI